MAPSHPEKERANPQNRGHHLSQQEKLPAAVLYLKGNWEMHELARQMRVSPSAISRVVKES
jgi:DNA-binding MarR family transcriptional regulator